MGVKLYINQSHVEQQREKLMKQEVPIATEECKEQAIQQHIHTKNFPICLCAE